MKIKDYSLQSMKDSHSESFFIFVQKITMFSIIKLSELHYTSKQQSKKETLKIKKKMNAASLKMLERR